MKAHYHPAGAVIVHHKVVDAEHLVMRGDGLLYPFNELLRGRLAEKGTDRFFG